MSATDLTTDRAPEQTSESVGHLDREPTLTLDLALSEGRPASVVFADRLIEALRVLKKEWNP